jgi:hypothetical protein|tara:strand:+ start:36686 stop:37027 length:342 start_codon:yes stop_codon:yes gene_type:complete
MRLFNLFLRRAGVQTMPAGIVKKPAVSRLTLVCSRAHMGQIRKALYRDFGSAGLNVGSMQVDRAPDPALVTACVTVSCPDDLKPALMSQARQLKKVEGVRDVRWGDHRHIVLN